MLYSRPSEQFHGECAEEQRNGPVMVKVEFHQLAECGRVVGVHHLYAVVAEGER